MILIGTVALAAIIRKIYLRPGMVSAPLRRRFRWLLWENARNTETPQVVIARFITLDDLKITKKTAKEGRKDVGSASRRFGLIRICRWRP
jgi:hypothetical protein